MDPLKRNLISNLLIISHVALQVSQSKGNLDLSPATNQSWFAFCHPFMAGFTSDRPIRGHDVCFGPGVGGAWSWYRERNTYIYTLLQRPWWRMALCYIKKLALQQNSRVVCVLWHAAVRLMCCCCRCLFVLLMSALFSLKLSFCCCCYWSCFLFNLLTWLFWCSSCSCCCFCSCCCCSCCSRSFSAATTFNVVVLCTTQQYWTT